MNFNGFEILQFNQYSFPSKAKTHTCPVCSHTRKKKKDKCLQIYWDTGLAKCYHGDCGELLQLHTYKKKNEVVTYKKPEKKIKSDLQPKLIEWFSSRGISEQTLSEMKISNSNKWMPKAQKQIPVMEFNYFFMGELINVKSRGKDKDFMFEKECELIMYNLDAIVHENTCVIVEGEMDALAFHEAGIKNVCSVPNGFTVSENLSLSYLDDYYEFFESKEKIYLACDNDEPGRNGQKELIRRFGSEKCFIVDLKDCKDSNDYLLRHGKESLANRISVAKEIKIEGVFELNDVRNSMKDSFLNGKLRGTTTYFPEIDEAWTHRPGEVNVWTGYENEGKSTFLNQLLLIKASFEDVKSAVFTPENFPLDDFYDELVECYIGKSADRHFKSLLMSEKEYDTGMDFVNDHFFAIYPEQDFKLESIFERTKYLIRKKGIRNLIIDPYNTIEHFQRSNEREELYISRFMSTLKRFAVDNWISIHLVAHQNSAKVNPNTQQFYRPWSSNIKGGAVFAQKADNVLFIQRPDLNTDRTSTAVLFGSLKIKKQKLVGIPQDISGIDYDRKSNRYFVNGVSPMTKIDCKRGGIDYETVIKMPLMTPDQVFDIPDNEKETEVLF